MGNVIGYIFSYDRCEFYVDVIDLGYNNYWVWEFNL